MARLPIHWGPNVVAPDSDYPSGRSKNIPSGTPMNELTMGDFQQFFFKMLREAVITANGLPDNEYSGNQYFQAAGKLFRKYGAYILFDRSFSLANVNGLFNTVVRVEPGSPNAGNIALLDSTLQDLDYGTVTVVNDSSFSVDILPGGSDTINGSASLTVAAGDVAEVMLIKSDTDWVVLRNNVK
jgi:hypothetical protein